jgi:hypothetical protein
MISHPPPVSNPVQREPDRQPVNPASSGQRTQNGNLKLGPKGSRITLPLTAQRCSGVPVGPPSSWYRSGASQWPKLSAKKLSQRKPR